VLFVVILGAVVLLAYLGIRTSSSVDLVLVIGEVAVIAFAGFEAAAALGDEARNARRSIPASAIGIVIVTGIFYLLVASAEMSGVWGGEASPASPCRAFRWAISPARTGRVRHCWRGW